MSKDDGNCDEALSDKEREWEDFGDALHDLEENCDWWQLTRSRSAWVVTAHARPVPSLGIPETSYGKIWYRRKGESLRSMIHRAIDISLANDRKGFGKRPWNPQYPDESPMTPTPEAG